MRKFKFLGGFALMMSLLVGCGNTETAPEPTANLSETIQFGVMSTIDAIPIVIAEERGFFEKRGLNIEIIPFSSAMDREAALRAGELDGLVTDLIGVTLANEGGFELKITGASTGNFTLIANESITSIEDLKGKTVLISSNTSIEHTLDRMLESAGLSADDIIKEEVPAIPTRMELLRNNQADAAVLPEPFVTIAKASGLVALTDTVEINFNPFITAFTQEAIDLKSDEIKAFYEAYAEAVKYLNTTPLENYIDIVVERVGFPAELKDQVSLPEFVFELPNNDDVNSAIQWLKDRGLITQDFVAQDLISDIAVK